MQVSKPKIIQLSLLALSSIIILTSFINFKGFHAKFYNKTGENLDSLMIAGTLIGNLKSNESTKSIVFKEFEFDGSIPYEKISANSNTKKLDMLHWSWCGTERNTKSRGSYSFDIKKALDNNGNTCLYLVEHNKKIFWEEK
ncbi:hypothetical protein K6T82_16380 [Flavobacterium sp. 17A]|uniref:Uncharacterized protein n=1 Tax=Flavobacterium potami TaxID=2872310 RepID=A0A9X1KSK3_9FLAO|nr:hypothetical protein [Flavobacterium potami]MBZ4036351.1 hypothetical protein [Flavobacterium potami]